MLIINAKTFIEDAFHDGVNVRVKDGKIAQIGLLAAEENEEVIDAQGGYLVPGFVDIHIHGYAGKDCMEGEESVRHMSREMKKGGVAAFVPTTMSADVEGTRKALSGIQRVMQAQEKEGAAVLGAHMEAPFLSANYKGAQEAKYFKAPSVQAYEEMVHGMEDAVCMMTIAPEEEGALDFIAYLTAQGVVACCAHSSATAEQVHAAADVGLSQITHLFNAQTPLSHRAPGVPGAGLTDERIAVQVIADGIHLHSDILRLAALCKADAKTMILITDAMMAAGMPDGMYSLGGQAVVVKEGAARLESGALAGSTLTMARAVKNMITLAHIAPEKVIPMATSVPADRVGAKDYGRIAEGCDGTLVLLDDEWNIQQVVGA